MREQYALATCPLQTHPCTTGVGASPKPSTRQASRLWTGACLWTHRRQNAGLNACRQSWHSCKEHRKRLAFDNNNPPRERLATAGPSPTHPSRRATCSLVRSSRKTHLRSVKTPSCLERRDTVGSCGYSPFAPDAARPHSSNWTRYPRQHRHVVCSAFQTCVRQHGFWRRLR